DWSSDVCSSDLDPTASGRAWLLVGVFDRISLIGAGLVGVVRSWRRDKRLRGGLWPLLLRLLLLLCCSGGVHGHGSFLLFLGDGRASGRERGVRCAGAARTKEIGHEDTIVSRQSRSR